ncbi:MAG: MBL fold metallo-hydrolase [Oscillospiraceae bacterium]|nr:MBL fold metallo-hydrolase [Oscillospiraceae bacterium]
MKKLRNLSLWLLAAALLLSACGGAGKQSQTAPEQESGQQPQLQVFFFSCGKADAMLLTTEHGAVLLDAGNKGFGKEILAYCRDKGIYSLDYLILSHFDKDHIGGAPRVLQGLPVRQLLQPDGPGEGSAWENYAAALQELGVEPVTVREDLSFTLDGVRFTVNPPKASNYADSAANNVSLIVSVECGDCRLLFTGDAENLRLEEWTAAHRERCDFIKMPHHGAWHRALEPLLTQAQPSYALITCSDAEPEEAKTLRKLEKLDVQVFLTRLGPVLLDCDGRSISLHYVDK